MATKAKKKSSKKKDEAKDAEGYLPIEGIAPKTYPALDKMCAEYLAAEKAHNKAMVNKKERYAILIGGMKERELTKYGHHDSGEVFERDLQEKLTHKTWKKNAAIHENKGINPDQDSAPITDELDEDEGESEKEPDAIPA